MKIDKEFNSYQLGRIRELLNIRKNDYKIDLHIHTAHSADGTSTVEEAIRCARAHEFDIISITDHDSIDAYRTVLKMQLHKDLSMPVIVPGIEFAVSFPEYEGRCHMLKYLYDENDLGFVHNLEQNKEAYRKRVSIWFERISENRTLQFFFQNHDIFCSEQNYWSFLHLTAPSIPEYATLMKYLYSLLSEKGVTVWDVYQKEMEYVSMDHCEERRRGKFMALERFQEKYACQDIANNYRKLKPILAPIGIDDCIYPRYESSGCLSVNEYDQVDIKKLKNSGINVVAHPDIRKLRCIELLGDVIQGIERNYRSTDSDNSVIYARANETLTLTTLGSDKHTERDNAYEEDAFYRYSYADLCKFHELATTAVNKQR